MNATTGPSRFETTTFGWGEELSLRAGFGVGTWDLYAFLTAAPRGMRARNCYETETRILTHKLHSKVTQQCATAPTAARAEPQTRRRTPASHLSRSSRVAASSAAKPLSRRIASKPGSTTGVLSRERLFRGGFRRRGAGDAAAAPRMSARNEASSS